MNRFHVGAKNMHLASTALGKKWQQLPPRDRLALKLMAAFLTGITLYLGLWLPVERRMQDAKTSYEQQHSLWLYLQQNEQLARQLVTTTGLAPEQLQGLVTSTSQQQGLSVERFNNDDDKNLQITFKQVSFETLLRWLVEIQGQGVNINEVQLDRTDSGTINAQLTLKVNS